MNERNWHADLEKLVTIATYPEHEQLLDWTVEDLLKKYGAEGLVTLLAKFAGMVIVGTATQVRMDHEEFRLALFGHMNDMGDLAAQVEDAFKDFNEDDLK